jgi:hypothetical protein
VLARIVKSTFGNLGEADESAAQDLGELLAEDTFTAALFSARL